MNWPVNKRFCWRRASNSTLQKAKCSIITTHYQVCVRWRHWSGVAIFCHERDNSTGQKAQAKYFSFISDRADSQQSTWKDNTMDDFTLGLLSNKNRSYHRASYYIYWHIITSEKCKERCVSRLTIKNNKRQPAWTTEPEIKTTVSSRYIQSTCVLWMQQQLFACACKWKGDVQSADNTKLRNCTYTESYYTKTCCFLCVET